MQENDSNYVGFGLFFFLIVIIILVSSTILFLNTRSKNQEKVLNESNEVVVSDKNKVDKNKDFVYFTEEEVISDALNIIYKVPIINLDSEDAKTINNEIKEYASNIKNTLEKGNETKCPTNESTDIYKTNYLDYAVYTYEEYVTLLLRESTYSCTDGFSTSSKVKSYTFDVLSGKLLSFDALLTKYNTTLTKVVEQIRSNLNKEQTIIDGVSTIKIEETINSLKEQSTYVIYVDEFGDLILNYVVKTSSVDYNDTITIN